MFSFELSQSNFRTLLINYFFFCFYIRQTSLFKINVEVIEFICLKIFENFFFEYFFLMLFNNIFMLLDKVIYQIILIYKYFFTSETRPSVIFFFGFSLQFLQKLLVYNIFLVAAFFEWIFKIFYDLLEIFVLFLFLYFLFIDLLFINQNRISCYHYSLVFVYFETTIKTFFKQQRKLKHLK